MSTRKISLIYRHSFDVPSSTSQRHVQSEVRSEAGEERNHSTSHYHHTAAVSSRRHPKTSQSCVDHSCRSSRAMKSRHRWEGAGEAKMTTSQRRVVDAETSICVRTSTYNCLSGRKIFSPVGAPFRELAFPLGCGSDLEIWCPGLLLLRLRGSPRCKVENVLKTGKNKRSN